jgi:hypothetical protein
MCNTCPKYVKITGKRKQALTADDFCNSCINEKSAELKIYCERNRFFQKIPVQGEDFDCYKYCPKRNDAS